MSTDEWEQQFDERLDAWLDTFEHEYHCTARDEGQRCCLDSRDDHHRQPTQTGREWVKAYIRELLERERDERREEERARD